MIRHANHRDVPAMVEMGRQFHCDAGWGDITEFSNEDCAATLAKMVGLDDAILLVVEREGNLIGMAGGLASPIYFNHAHKTGQELFFWMEPGSRNGDGRQLLEALEEEAREIGCQSWVMISLDRIRPEATGLLYKRRGYRASEHSWIKRL